MTDGAIEAACREMHKPDPSDEANPYVIACGWDQLREDYKERYRSDMRAAIAAYERAMWQKEDKAIEVAFHAHGNAPIIVDVQTAYNAMCAAIAAYEHAMWRPIEEAPKDGSLFLVWCPAYEGLPSMFSLCAWHPDAGFCVDELRQPTYYRPLPPPPQSPPTSAGNAASISDCARG